MELSRNRCLQFFFKCLKPALFFIHVYLLNSSLPLRFLAPLVSHRRMQNKQNRDQLVKHCFRASFKEWQWLSDIYWESIEKVKGNSVCSETNKPSSINIDTNKFRTYKQWEICLWR